MNADKPNMTSTLSAVNKPNIKATTHCSYPLYI